VRSVLIHPTYRACFGQQLHHWLTYHLTGRRDRPLPRRALVSAVGPALEERSQASRRHGRHNLLDSHVRAFAADVPQIAQWDDHEVPNSWYRARPSTTPATPRKRVDVLAARAGRRSSIGCRSGRYAVTPTAVSAGRSRTDRCWTWSSPTCVRTSGPALSNPRAHARAGVVFRCPCPWYLAFYDEIPLTTRESRALSWRVRRGGGRSRGPRRCGPRR
jgi:hypothetical protein